MGVIYYHDMDKMTIMTKAIVMIHGFSKHHA